MLASIKYRFLYAILFIFITIAVYLFHTYPKLFFLALALPILIVYIPSAIFDSKKIIFAVLFFIIVFPQTYWYTNIVLVNQFSAFFIILLISVHTFKRIHLDNSMFFIFLLYTVLITINVIRGIFWGYNRDFILDEAIKYLIYPTAFYFFLSIFNDEKDVTFIKKTLNYIVVFTSIAAFEIILMYLFITKGGRVLTRFGNVILVGLIISLGFIKEKKINFLSKLLYFFSIIIMALGILLTMQRSLWIATSVSILVYLIADVFSNKNSSKDNIVKVIVFCLIFISVIFVFNNITLGTEEVVERTENMQKGEVDSSLAIRFYTFFKVFDITKDNILFGNGLGDSAFFPLLTSKVKNLVDNSYISLFWKMGIVGVLLFLVLYINIIYKLLYVIKKSKDTIIKSISVIILSVFMGQLVNSLACVVLTQYHYNFIWALFIAITELFYMKIVKAK